MEYEKQQTANLLLGVKYNLIRKEFYHLPVKKFSDRVNHILITTGNLAPYCITEKIFQCLRHSQDLEECTFHVIVGNGFSEETWKRLRMINDSSPVLYEKPSKIMQIMTRCDLTVSAGGSTLYELAACGVATVAFAYADNRLPQIKAFERQGLLKYIGFYNGLHEQELRRYICFYRDNIDISTDLYRDYNRW